MSKQKFKAGAKVLVQVEGTGWERHLEEGRPATVLYSYGEKYGGGDFSEYSLDFSGDGQMSWFDEKDLTEVEK